MRTYLKMYHLLIAVALFISIPIVFYLMSDAPQRSLLKECLSLITVLSLTLVVGQFFLARSNSLIMNSFHPMTIQKVHKAIAYTALVVLLVHPFLIVFPRYFEAGVKPLDAFIIMLTTLSSIGILLGLLSWTLLILIGITAAFRASIIRRWKIKYPNWRYFHGVASVIFIVIALWHAIDLGRHTNVSLSIYLVISALLGGVLLFRLYWISNKRNRVSEHQSKEISNE